jgi:hypothetical protein
MLVLSTPPFITARQRLAELAIAHRLPTMCQNRLYVEAAGLMSYYPKPEDYWRRGAFLAGHQCQDGEGARPHGPAVRAGAGGSGDRIVER